MAIPPKQNAAQKNAQQHFSAAEEGDKARKNAVKKERNDLAANTAKLRELRLAKEAAEQAEVARLAAENPSAAKPKSAPRKKPSGPKTRRMFY